MVPTCNPTEAFLTPFASLEAILLCLGLMASIYFSSTTLSSSCRVTIIKHTLFFRSVFRGVLSGLFLAKKSRFCSFLLSANFTNLHKKFGSSYNLPKKFKKSKIVRFGIRH